MRRVKDKLELLSRVAANRTRIAGMGVARLGVFGSFVRNEQGRDSDVDLLVEFAPGQKNFDNFMALGFYLEELFDSPRRTGYPGIPQPLHSAARDERGRVCRCCPLSTSGTSWTNPII